MPVVAVSPDAEAIVYGTRTEASRLADVSCVDHGVRNRRSPAGARFSEATRRKPEEAVPHE